MLYSSLAIRLPEEILDRPGGGSDYLYHIEGDILIGTETTDDEVGGKFELYYADIEAAASIGIDAHEVLDTHSQTHEYSRLYDRGGSSLSSAVLKICPDAFLHDNLLIVYKLEVLHRYRGFGVGLCVLRRLIERFHHGAGVVALEPVPLQFGEQREDSIWNKQMQYESYTLPLRRATQKLQQYYGRLGFRRVPRTNYMVRAAGLPLPPADDVCR